VQASHKVSWYFSARIVAISGTYGAENT